MLACFFESAAVACRLDNTSTIYPAQPVVVAPTLTLSFYVLAGPQRHSWLMALDIVLYGTSLLGTPRVPQTAHFLDPADP